MVSVDQKTFDNGVVRVVGVSKLDCILFVTMQTLVFVIPSLIMSYSMAIVINHFVLRLLYTPEMGLSFSPLPDYFATI